MNALFRRAVTAAAILAPALWLTACASSSVTQTGAISSYGTLEPVKTTRTKARIWASGPDLAAAKSVRIDLVRYGPLVDSHVSPGESALIANRIGRTLCLKLSDRYDIVPSPGRADLTVKVAITRMTATDRTAAAASLPLRAATMIFGIPFAARFPVGLGAFAAEGEAVDLAGRQQAAMVWARGADMFTNRARISKIGDAYDLSGAFAGDLAALIVTGRNPLHDVPPMPGRERTRPIPEACAAYGKVNSAEGFVGSFVGAPPSVTEGKPPAPR